jgi:hypothetical protein
MNFTVSIPQDLVPGIIATAALMSEQTGQQVTLQMVVQDAAEKASRKACEDHHVGPSWTGPILPKFNADGTLYTP